MDAQGPPNLRPYAGRWVAMVQGRIAGVGASAEAARIAAQLSHPKDKPQVIFVPEQPPLELPPLMAEIREALPAGVLAWLVGGAVRDALLGRRVDDLDFVVDGDALGVARTVARALRAAFYPLDPERGVGRVILTRDDVRFTLDFARQRGADLTADLAGRDFTVNAMAVAVVEPHQLIDPLGGEIDLHAKVIRACSPRAIADDPVRGIRAIRLAAQLGFRIERETRAEVRAQAAALAAVSVERCRDEFIRCLGGPRPGAALRALDWVGLLHQLAPEMAALKGVSQSPPHVFDAWEHTLAVVTRLDEVTTVLNPIHDVEAASDLTLGLVSVRLGRHRQSLAAHLDALIGGERPARWLLMLAALLHDVGKPLARTVEGDGRIRFFNHEQVGAEITAHRLTRLHFSTAEIQRARTIVAHHPRPRLLAQETEVSRRAVYRFFRDTGEAGVDVSLLALADALATYGDRPPPQDDWARLVGVCADLLEAYFERREQRVKPPALVTGHDLMTAFGLEAGPRLGKLLEAVREAQAAGEVSDRAEALDYVRQHLGDE